MAPVINKTATNKTTINDTAISKTQTTDDFTVTDGFTVEESTLDKFATAKEIRVSEPGNTNIYCALAALYFRDEKKLFEGREPVWVIREGDMYKLIHDETGQVIRDSDAADEQIEQAVKKGYRKHLKVDMNVEDIVNQYPSGKKGILRLRTAHDRF